MPATGAEQSWDRGTLTWFVGALVALVLASLAARLAAPEETKPPGIHHILVEVSDLEASIAFYRDVMGLEVRSNDGSFAQLEARNMGVYLWNKRWDWEAPRKEGERQGLGMYPHFQVRDVATTVDRARRKGYEIVQEPRRYTWGTEVFVADPDGYIWAVVD